MAFYRISELAKKSQISTDTLRFYEKKGLIQPRFRADNQYRYYDDDSLKRLQFIQHCRALDLSLKEIETLLALEQNPTQDCSVVNDMIDHHLAELKSKIESLMQFQQQLEQLRQRCLTKTTVADCQILKQLESHHRGCGHGLLAKQ